MTALDDLIVRGGELPPEVDGVPLLVTAHLAAPVVTADEMLMLDGIAAFAAFKRAEALLGRDILPPLDGALRPTDFRLPLRHWTQGGTWGWCASAAIWTYPIRRSVHYVTKKPPIDDMRRMTDVAAVNIASGPMKAKRAPAAQVAARSITWYADGDRDALYELLHAVQCVGKLPGHGRGWVARWEVEQVDDAPWSDYRPMPIESGIKRRIRPPYWHPMDRVQVDPTWR